MLQVGNGDSMGVGGYTLEENRTHFGLWCILAAPLILGNDIRYMSNATLSVITNPEVIAVNQDPLGIQGRKMWTNGPGSGLIGQDVWVKPLSDGSKAVLVLNRTQRNAPPVVVKFDTILGAPGAYLLRDLWERRDMGVFTDSFVVAGLGPFGSVMFKAVRSTKLGSITPSRATYHHYRLAVVRNAIVVMLNERSFSLQGILVERGGRIGSDIGALQGKCSGPMLCRRSRY